MMSAWDSMLDNCTVEKNQKSSAVASSENDLATIGKMYAFNYQIKM